MPTTPKRTRLGTKFSEAARTIWMQYILKDEWSFGFLAGVLGTSSGTLTGWLFGDTVPTLASAIKIEDTIGVPPRLWLMKPYRSFTPPTDRKDK